MRTRSAHGRNPGRPRALTEEQIGAAVVDLGFENFSVRALADRLGVGERTLYRYSTGRDGLVALGLEHLFRVSEAVEPGFVDPGPDVTWRDILLEVAAGVQAFLDADPAAGAEMARGVRAPAQARRLREYGAALIRRGFSADDAVLALHGVFDLVLSCFRDARYLDTVTPDDATPQRAALVRRLAAGPGTTTLEQQIQVAMDRTLVLDPADWLRARLDLLLDGIGTRRDAAGPDGGGTTATGTTGGREMRRRS